MYAFDMKITTISSKYIETHGNVELLQIVASAVSFAKNEKHLRRQTFRNVQKSIILILQWFDSNKRVSFKFEILVFW